LTIAGGKWTTYRAMAEETVDKAVKVFGLEGRVRSGCVTETVRLVGSDGWSRNMFIGLIQRYGLETEVAKHLSDSYGDHAWTVLSLASPTGKTWPLHGIRISPNYPYIEAEVRYAVRNEYAQTAIDVLARRTRLSFLNVQATLDALPRVVDIMADELGWTAKQKHQQIADGVEFLKSMGLSPDAGVHSVQSSGPTGWLEKTSGALWRLGGYATANPAAAATGRSTEYSRSLFEAGEVFALKEAFDKRATAVNVEDGTTGAVAGQLKIQKVDLWGVVKDVEGYEGIPEKDYEYALEEAGFKGRKEIDFDEFVEICGTVKEVSIAPAQTKPKHERLRIPVEKSGGGV